MNAKQRRTLAAEFRHPTPTSLRWDDIESLFQAAECNIMEGRGSRISIQCDELIENFHRPHPGKEAKQYQVRLARSYLARIGVVP